MNVPRLLGRVVCPVSRNQISVRTGKSFSNCDTRFAVPLGEASSPSWLVIWLKKLCSESWIEAAGPAWAAATAAACVVVAAGLAIEGAAANGVNLLAAAEDAA